MHTLLTVRSLALVLLFAPAVSACRSAHTSPPQTDSTTAASAVDSTLSRDETLSRFRVGLDSVGALAGGATSRNDLVRNFVEALAARDTAALTSLVMTKQEFAWLYYPTTPQGLPPYDLAPNLLWFLLEGRGSQGLSRAFRDLAGKALRYHSHTCDNEPSIEGENTVWGPCDVTLSVDGESGTARLFGPILERHGRFKFVNYTNRLE